MKTKVKTKNADQRHNDYEAGEFGYIDGYMQGADGTPCACVVTEGRIIMCPLNNLEVLVDVNKDEQNKFESIIYEIKQRR